MLAPFCLWLGLVAAAEGLNLGSRGPAGQANPLEEAAFFDNGQWVEEADAEKRRHGINYTWKLNQGSMDDFDVDQFCKDLPGDVLMVGDSITHQHYQAVVRQACPRSKHKRVAAPCWYTEFDKKHLIEEEQCCGGKRRITHIRNDWSRVHGPNDTWKPAPPECRMSHDNARLADGEEYNVTADIMEEAARPRNDARLLPWDFPEILSRFKVFIFNSGAHYHPNEDFREDVQGVVDLFQRHPEIDKRYVFWRTTMQGLKDCDAMQGKPPFQSLKEAEIHYNQNPWYEGPEFKRQNEIAKSVWTSHGYPLIDIYKSSMMNGHSGHAGGIDCLHYKDTAFYLYEHWNRILYNMMRRRAGSRP